MSCRISGMLPMQPAEFDSIACVGCFYFIYLISQQYEVKYHLKRCTNGVLICHSADHPRCNCDHPDFLYNIPEYATNRTAVTPLYNLELDPPLPDHFYELTKQCCEAARSCCRNTLMQDEQEEEAAVCPATWDGWQCFDASAPRTVRGSCPTYIYGEYSRNRIGEGQCKRRDSPLKHRPPTQGRVSQKECDVFGWGKAPDGSMEWTDYRGCMVVNDDAKIKLMAGVIAFSISLLCLIPAICILYLFRPLRNQPMFVLHRHLLISFLLSALFYLFNCFFFIIDGAPGDKLYFTNDLSCRILFLVQLRFLRLSTFSWMLAEGVYLFRLLHSTHTEGESLTPYKILCWGVPAVLSFFYGFLRQTFDNEGCWVSPSVYSWIEGTVIIPCVIALCTNVMLVGFIMFILVKKLRCDPHLERIQFNKAVRAALMLIPVFGLHFLLTIYRIPSLAHQVLNLVLDGLQGCAVSLIVCYTNKTVLESITKCYSNYIEELQLQKEFRTRTSIQTDTKTPLVHHNNNQYA